MIANVTPSGTYETVERTVLVVIPFKHPGPLSANRSPPRALVDLGAGLGQRFAHLARGQ